MYKQIRRGNVVNFYSKLAECWLNGHMLSTNDMFTISAGSNNVKGIPITLAWKIRFYKKCSEAIPLDMVKYVHELQHYFFKLFGQELVSKKQVTLPYVVSTF